MPACTLVHLGAVRLAFAMGLEGKQQEAADR